MRERPFTGLGQLVEAYLKAKLELQSARGLDFKTEVERITRINGAHITKGMIEGKNAFVGDVMLAIRHYYDHQMGPVRRRITVIPLDCLEMIFHCKFCPELIPYKTYGELAIFYTKEIRTRSRYIPSRLQHRSHLCDIANDMTRSMAKYFVAKGYIEYPEYNFKKRMEGQKQTEPVTTM